MQRSGLAKRLINAADYLLVDNDPESAFTPLCNAIDRVATEIYGKSGRAAYKRFISERMELITRVAFDGIAFLNMTWAIPPIHDEKGKTIKPHKTAPDGTGLYSLDQIIYHLVRCKLDHHCEIAEVLHDLASVNGKVRIGLTDGVLSIPFAELALGLLFAVMSEVHLRDELTGTVFEQVEWKRIPLIDLVGQKERILALSRSEETEGTPCQ